jgi:hypothetical protein
VAGRDEIRIVYAYLDTLAINCRRTAELFESGSELIDVSFTDNERVTDAYDEFLGDWDRHRNDLSEAVGSAGQAFDAVSTAFRGVEDELIRALDGG